MRVELNAVNDQLAECLKNNSELNSNLENLNRQQEQSEVSYLSISFIL